jgi:hypothetical protein
VKDKIAIDLQHSHKICKIVFLLIKNKFTFKLCSLYYSGFTSNDFSELDL